MDKPKSIIVIYRKWRDDAEIIALFPEIPSDVFGWYCESYMHLGQHSRADYNGVIRATVPASPEEYKDLHNEIRARYEVKTNPWDEVYKLKIRRRVNWRVHDKRRKDARRND